MLRCRILSICLFASVSMVANGETSLAEKTWSTKFEQAEVKARRLNLPMVIHFYANWCGPCRDMERDVLSSSTLAKQLNGRFIAVKVNVDRREDLSDRFNIEVLPTDVIVSPKGRVLSKFTGYQAKSRYITRLERVETQWSRSQPRTTTIVKNESPKPASPVSRIRIVAGRSPGYPAGNSKSAEIVPAVPRKTILGLKGYSPVYLFDNRDWQKGSERFSWEYKGIVYYMADENELAQFQSRPAKYAARLLGCDPVVLYETDRAIPGDIQFGAYYDNELYLFSSAESRKKFRKNPPRYTRTRHVLRIDQIERTRLR